MIGNLHDIDIKLLRIFHAVAKSGGFTAAQAELNIGRSAISNKMSQLEKRLGMHLCERGSSGFQLTDQGHVVLLATKELFDSLEKFKSDIADAENKITGSLNIGIADSTVSLPEPHIYDAIRMLHEISSNLKLSIHIGSNDELTSRLLDASLHFAISPFFRKYDTLQYTPLFTEEQALYCSHQHPLSSKSDEIIKNSTLAEYAYANWDGNINRDEFLFNNIHSSLTPTLEGAAYLILSGCYISHLPTHYADQWERTGEMQRVNTVQNTRQMPFDIAQKRGITPPLIVKKYLEILKGLYETSGHKADKDN